MQALPQQEHPVIGLDWETARDNFYAAVAGGLDAGDRVGRARRRAHH